MDDRFEMILTSQSISDGDGVSYVSDTYTAYGNDGNHFNDFINAPPKTAVGQEIADEILYASDPLPLFATFNFDQPVSVETEIAPNEFMLFQNYPNPFNPTTIINYSIPELSLITVKIYDVLGKEVAKLVNEEKAEGTYEVEFNATALPSGVYFYRLQTGNFVEIKKMMLMK